MKSNGLQIAIAVTVACSVLFSGCQARDEGNKAEIAQIKEKITDLEYRLQATQMRATYAWAFCLDIPYLQRGESRYEAIRIGNAYYVTNKVTGKIH